MYDPEPCQCGDYECRQCYPYANNPRTYDEDEDRYFFNERLLDAADYQNELAKETR